MERHSTYCNSGKGKCTYLGFNIRLVLWNLLKACGVHLCNQLGAECSFASLSWHPLQSHMYCMTNQTYLCIWVLVYETLLPKHVLNICYTIIIVGGYWNTASGGTIKEFQSHMVASLSKPTTPIVLGVLRLELKAVSVWWSCKMILDIPLPSWSLTLGHWAHNQGISCPTPYAQDL